MDALTMLRLQVEWGADEALDPDPNDRLRPVVPREVPPVMRRAEPAMAVAPAGSPPGGSPSSVSPGERALASVSPGERALASVSPGERALASVSPGERALASVSPGERALAAAGQADTLAGLRDAIAAFDGCALKDIATNLVFAAGDTGSGILLIGEPPGNEEDRSGTPFAGREGALLDAMLDSIGLKRDSMLLTPLIPWRPPGGRPPNPGELAVCLPFLHRLIALTAPTMLVLMGTLATRTLLPGRRRGIVWADCAVPGVPAATPALALPGTSAMLKTPALRRDAWAGLRLLRRRLDADGQDR